MGMAGCKLAISKAMIVKAIKAHRGCVAKVARGLRISRSALQNRIDDDPELLKLVHETRHEYDQMQLDEAEDTLMYAMQNRKRDTTNAVKTAMYILNNKGRLRGFRRGLDEGVDEKLNGTLHKIDKVIIVDGKHSEVLSSSSEIHSGSDS